MGSLTDIFTKFPLPLSSQWKEQEWLLHSEHDLNKLQRLKMSMDQ